MKIDAPLLSHCHAIIGRVAPELKNAHVVPDSTFDGLTMAKDALGFAVEGDKITFDIAERIDGYRSGSPVVCLCESAIAKESGDDAFRDGVLGVLLHEAAHLLPRPPEAGRISNPIDRSFDCPAVRTRLDEKRAEAIAIPEPGPDADDAIHGWRFLRRCVHLWGRASLLGWDVECSNILGDPFWYCCQMPHWAVTLFGEIVQYRNAPFATIESTTPPERFLKMWEHAISTYNRFRGEMI